MGYEDAHQGLAFTGKTGAESDPEFPITHFPGKFANLLHARLHRMEDVNGSG
jgi:hypothetical protein